MGGNVLYYGWGKEYKPWRGLVRQLELDTKKWGREFEAIGMEGRIWKKMERLKKAAFVFIWNGLQETTYNAMELCKVRGIPYAVIEQGWHPQKETYFCDPMGGMCSMSSLNRPLHWVLEGDFNRMYRMREKLRAEHNWCEKGEFVVAPLQIHNDTTVVYFSRYDTMDTFMEDVVKMYPDERIVIRPHPKSTAQRESRWPNVEMDSLYHPWLTVCGSSKVVVGITSTCLIEAAIMGKPVVALGDCPLRTHSNDVERCAAAYTALQTPRKAPQFVEICERFGVRPL